jgi:hypothetical protein
MKQIFTIIMAAFLAKHDTLFAQETPKDTNTLQHILKKGKWNGQVRNYLMRTHNHRKDLTDYYANALGGAFGYETANFRGFRAGFTGSFVQNTWSSDLTKPDSLTGQFNRYEIGLFDIENPAQSFIGRLDELYLSYHWKKSKITFGKQKLTTPWLNPQDGRMRPNFQEGVYVDFQEIKNLRIEAAWIYRFLVCSTEFWLTIPQSIGQYPTGITPDGVRSGYVNNLKSAGLGILGISYNITPNIKTQIWNYYTENIFNTSFWQTEAEIPFESSKSKHKAMVGVQLHYQTTLNNGGNPDPTLAYIPKGQQNWAFSSKIGWKNQSSQLSFNYTRIGKQGRFLFPREWGRDAFYTFLPRERNEGYGDVNAFMLQWGQNFSKNRLRMELSYGHYYLPDARNAFLNKYGFPSYNQVNVNFVYKFRGLLEGLQGQFLYVYKGKLGDTYDNPRFEFNKVNMSLYNLILNYNF